MRISDHERFGSFRKKSAVCFFAVCLLLLFVCDAFGQEPPRGTIVLITHKPEGFRNAFWDALRRGGETAAAEAGYLLEYRGVAASFGGDAPRAQDDEIRRAADMGAVGILITPVDRFRLIPAVRYAVIGGIPVVSIDSAIESDLVLGNVATNNYEGGLRAAQYMADLVGSGGVVMLAHPARSNRATQDRERAFIEGITRFGAEIAILSQDRFGDASVAGDTQAALELLSDFPEVRGIYSVSGSGLIGCLNAVESLGRTGEVIVIGWDADVQTLTALQEGSIHGIMQQDPESMSRIAVEILIDSLDGSIERRNVGIPAALITRETIDDPAVRSLIDPILSPRE